MTIYNNSPGEFGEKTIKKGFMAKGWYVIPTANIKDDGAPMAKTDRNCIILPDLQISGKGFSRWVEVKTKTKAAYLRIEKEYKHGICKRQYEHYKAIEGETGIPIWLVIWELETQEILIAPLNYLIHPQILSPEKSRMSFCEHGMVFFRKNDFESIDKDFFLSGNWDDTWIKSRQRVFFNNMKPLKPYNFKLF